MELEKVRELVRRDLKRKLPVPKKLKVRFFDKNHFKYMWLCIYDLGLQNPPREKEFYINSLNNNPLVKSFTSFNGGGVSNRNHIWVRKIFGVQ